MSSNPPSNRSRLRVLQLITLLFLVVPVGIILFVSVDQMGTFISPPDEPRPWAANQYSETYAPAVIQAIPDLTTLPRPVLRVDSPVIDGKFPASSTDSKLKIEFEASSIDSRSEYYEVFSADPTGTVTLPDGNQLRLTAVALILPSDVDWGDKRYQQAVPKWVDPGTGHPVSVTEKENWAREEKQVSHDHARLFLRVEKEGEAPLRWQWPEIHDARTEVSINSTSSWSSDDRHGMFWVDLEVWHQTSAKIAVHFAFGDLVFQEFALEQGAATTFGNHASLRLLEVLPHGHGSSSMGGGGGGGGPTTYRLSFDAYSTPQRSPRRSYIFEVWPPINGYLIDYRVNPKAGYRIFSGNYGISDVELYGKDHKATAVTLRRFPRLGRAVFELDSLPRLPEVNNLFHVPIPRVRIDYPSDFLRKATRAAEVRTEFRHSHQRIPRSEFPMTLEDTTPAKILTEYERLTGEKLYYERGTYQLTDEAPPGLWMRIKEWWRRTFP